MPRAGPDREQADAILRPASVARRAVDDGALTAAAVEPWLDELAAGPFLAAVTLFTVLARA